MDTDGTVENQDDNGGFPVEPPHQSGRSGRSSKTNKYRDPEADEESERSHRSGRRGRRHRNRDDPEADDGGGERRRSKRASGMVEQRSVKITRQGGVTTDDDRDEVIEVQILPQDDNWGDNTTAITGTSDRSSEDDTSRFAKNLHYTGGFDCTRYFSLVVSGVLSLVAFLTPIAFVALPSALWESQCGTPCDGLFIGMAFKLFLLATGSWALFFRRPRATMPRVHLFRAAAQVLVFVLLLAYWLFFAMRVLLVDVKPAYHGIVSYAVSLTDTLLFLHYVAVVVLELRHLQPAFVLKVVRSPDGLSRYYSVGQLTIQRAAVHVLENYYRDFQIFNSHLLRVPTTSRVAQKLSSFKFYDVDGSGGGGNDAVTGRARAVMTSAAHRRDQSRNERFYEEQEWERRMRKRKARLVVAAEEAFTHVKRVHEGTHPGLGGGGGGAHGMDPLEAAQSVFPSIARPLQKYLRITRQQPRWPMEAVLEHLALCISYNLAPRAFLEAFFEPGPTAGLLEPGATGRNQGWELCSDTVVNRALREGTTFQLRQGEVMLQVFVMTTPHYKLREEVFDYKKNRFALRLQSETSV